MQQLHQHQRPPVERYLQWAEQHADHSMTYLLRLRYCDGNGQAQRIDPQNYTRTGFADLESMFAFLLTKTDASQ